LMRERLAEWVENPCKNALVIFSFTCVGPIIRLWFTYRQVCRYLPIITSHMANSC
jgi:hypothetical protein